MELGDNFRELGYSEVFIEDAITSIEDADRNIMQSNAAKHGFRFESSKANDELEQINTPTICPRCRNNNAAPFAEACPYDEEMNADKIEYCYCCEDCRRDCILSV